MKIWVKLYTETLRDPKIGSLSWAHRGIWSALLALAGELDHRNESGEETGELDTIGNVAWYLRCTEDELQEAVREFTQRRMVHEENGVLFVTNYPQRQSRPPSSRSEQVADRVRRYRERRAKRNEDVTTLRKDSNEAETTLDTDTEIETEKETEKESPSAGADAPPTPADDGVPDPISLTVAEIQALDLAEDQWRQLLKQETQGKNRVSVHRHVQAVLNLPVEEEKHERAPPTGKNKLKLELADHFAEVTLIPLPSGSYPELNKRWWEPLLRIASVCDDDLERTKALIDWTVAEMDAARLTIKTPQSIEGNAVNEQLRRLREAERSNNGAHPGRGRAGREPPAAISAEEAERFRRLQEQRKRERAAGPT